VYTTVLGKKKVQIKIHKTIILRSPPCGCKL